MDTEFLLGMGSAAEGMIPIKRIHPSRPLDRRVGLPIRMAKAEGRVGGV